jgi:hypothetical protein
LYLQIQAYGTPRRHVSKVGSQQWLREQYGLGVDDIFNAAKAMIEEK